MICILPKNAIKIENMRVICYNYREYDTWDLLCLLSYRKGRTFVMNTERRKIIGVITTDPENIYQATVLEGIFKKANEFNFDVLVFTTFVKATHPNKEYLKGEANIFNVINFDELDGVILLTLAFKYHSDNVIYDQVQKLLKEKCRCPVITIDETMDDYECISTDDEESFRGITDHVIDVHNCRKIFFLAGEKDTATSDMRYRGFVKSLKNHNIEPDEKCIFYGEFWYTFGERIAGQIADGLLEKPEAVIAASDYIALGFISEACKRGYNIPEDIIVTGYDSVIESRTNEITLTSFVPPISESGEYAVVRLYEQIHKENLNYNRTFFGKLVCGMSCGCRISNSGKRDRNDYGYTAPYLSNEIDMQKFLMSYMTETLTESASMDECFNKVLNHAYLVDNCMEYFLCTCDSWDIVKDDDDSIYGNSAGYTEKMKVCVYRCIPDLFHEWKEYTGTDPYIDTFFETSRMLPKIFDDHRDVAAVFYFAPVHFNGRRIGYSVMRCAHGNATINFIYQLWSRFVNNALEMIRVRELLYMMSTHDIMTGLFNRNSLKHHINKQLEHSRMKDLELYVQFIDMNRLKFINDVYGHDAGDEAIKVLAQIVSSVYTTDCACVRMGGDEFVVIGCHDDAENEIKCKTQVIKNLLENYNLTSKKEYDVTASFGSEIGRPLTFEDVESMINIADERMYEYKKEFKKKHGIDSSR